MTMKKILFAAAMAAGLHAFTVPSLAQEAQEAEAPAAPEQPVPESSAASLDELLQDVVQGKLSESEMHQQRVQEFRQQKSEQERLLQQARNEKARLERRSADLEDTRAKNEEELIQLQQQLDEAKGELRELFGVLQQVAGDTRSIVTGSLVSLQTRAKGIDREQALADLIEKSSRASSLPSIDEIEVLWQELQRELTESGKVTQFAYDVISADGTREQVDLVRVGAFNLVSEGKYYTYNASTGEVIELGQQPANYVAGTRQLANAAPAETVRFGLDPTRGQLLQLLIQKPDLMEQVDQGGAIGYIILAMGAFAVLIVIYKVVALLLTQMKVKSQIKSDQANTNNPLGRILSVYQENRSVDVETLELKLDEAILRETPAIERFSTFVKIISAVAPLLGLLGTVTGMIATFQAITLFGTGDPKLMAGGISQALVTTQLGLVVAIPTLLLHSLVAGMSRNIIQILEEQSAGIIALHAEKERA
ncbi:outer membrane transport energization protein ExbB [Rhodothalassium salexigens DSM 2132]|uniref:Outer membrane transport energization protein ExbB n=1 Tax=Rhodothalassium salexigens DSM 2132 TaxID=1188247 RepID=A0A4R2PL87_RHOSA|nr:MotA/TolQ/ExbB proton channel family protein [Rhodothalassium salexigens]MBB4210979.1 biopolymer transport protein ExbB [Rhodothalassium salexigens DSM 2132]TCP36363.1 outer membrane transport energization protein ExbB [Rhodothalassium salexigens DSM 2132]